MPPELPQVVTEALQFAYGTGPPVNGGPPPIVRVEDLPNVLEIATEPISWLVNGLIQEGSIFMISGDPGCGKSTIITAICGSIAFGVPFAGRAVKQRQCLILDRENPSTTVAERMRRSGISGGIHIWGQWCASDPPGPWGAAIQEWVARTDPKPVIVLDSAVSFFEGNENSSVDVRQFLHRLRKLAASGCSIILIHHTGKAETAKKFRGSSDWGAGVDLAFVAENLSADPNCLDRIRLSVVKRRVPVESTVLLEWDGPTCQWTIRESTALEDCAEILGRLLRGNPGLSKRKLADLAAQRGVTRKRAYDWVNRGLESKLLYEESARGGRRLYFREDDSGGDF